MTLYNAIRHPAVHIRHTRHPAKVAGERPGFNDRLAAWITAKIGSMGTVYVCLGITVIWMVVGARAVLGFDPYPYPFLLFLGNVVQLLLIFIILLGQQVLGRTADKRSAQTYEDAEAVLHACERLQAHLRAQDLAIRHIVEHMNECRPRAAEQSL
jgi:uncharacterized membrane protein